MAAGRLNITRIVACLLVTGDSKSRCSIPRHLHLYVQFKFLDLKILSLLKFKKKIFKCEIQALYVQLFAKTICKLRICILGDWLTPLGGLSSIRQWGESFFVCSCVALTVVVLTTYGFRQLRTRFGVDCN